MASTESQALLTAEQFLLLPDSGRPTELVRGKVIEMTPPGARHGQVCYRVGRIIGNFVDQQDLGHVLCNDSGVVTERNPDSVRGADVAFFSFARLPKGRLARGYPAIPPDVVFEVRSPTDRRGQIEDKVAEYLSAGVKAVCVLDPDRDTIHLHRADQPPRVLDVHGDLTLPEIDGEFLIPVKNFFE